MKMTNDQITATQRVSVSLDADLVTQAADLANYRGIQLSVILDHYVRAGLRDDAVAQVMSDYLAGYEPSSTQHDRMERNHENNLRTFRNDRQTVSNIGRRRVINCRWSSNERQARVSVRLPCFCEPP